MIYKIIFKVSLKFKRSRCYDKNESFNITFRDVKKFKDVGIFEVKRIAKGSLFIDINILQIRVLVKKFNDNFYIMTIEAPASIAKSQVINSTQICFKNNTKESIYSITIDSRSSIQVKTNNLYEGDFDLFNMTSLFLNIINNFNQKSHSISKSLYSSKNLSYFSNNSNRLVKSNLHIIWLFIAFMKF